MFNVPDILKPGAVHEVGKKTFHAEDIIRFAKKFDPQVFHLDAEAAKSTLLGGLCASGWHTASTWMRLQRDFIAMHVAALRKAGQHAPEFGPSPGIKDLKWIRPVFAGDTVHYTNRVTDMRESNSRPGWWIATLDTEAKNQKGEPVLSFTSSAFLMLLD